MLKLEDIKAGDLLYYSYPGNYSLIVLETPVISGHGREVNAAVNIMWLAGSSYGIYANKYRIYRMDEDKWSKLC